MSPISKEFTVTEHRGSIQSIEKSATPSAVFAPESIHKSIELVHNLRKLQNDGELRLRV